MMNQISKLIVAFCFAFTFGAVIQADAPRLEAQFVKACGCGNAKCRGCLKGKLFPVKKLAPSIKPKNSCACESCAAAASRSTVTSDVLVSTEYLPTAVAPVATACGCGKKQCGCKTLRKVRTPRTRSYPQCDCDFCELKVSKIKEKKKCFEVSQKEICVPAVQVPWKKNCPRPKSKVRVVNVLKSKTYECPGCKYEWKVFEPDVPEGNSESATPDVSPEEVAPIEEVDPAAPKMNVPEPPEIEKLDLETVPPPPVESN